MRKKQLNQLSSSVKSFLVDQDDGDSVHEFPVVVPFRIGRREGFDLCLSSPNVSGLHAEILEEDGALWLHDLNSTNGTFVNDRRIYEKTKLRNSDSIVFGNRRFCFVLSVEDRGPIATIPNANAAPKPESPEQKFQRLLDAGAVPFFQPIHQISTDSQRLIGYEVLGRSRIFGLTTPVQMFAAAIPLEMESELSRVLRQRGIEAAQNKLSEDLKLFVNTHSAELERGLLGESLKELREAYPNRPVVLELSEKNINDLSKFSELRSMLTDLDIGLALHDFSAGKIHLDELNEIAPDIVKFDCALLQEANKASAKRQRLIRAMVKMVKELGITPMAEYIESKEEHESLIELGFDYAQGFYYGRPIDVDTVSAPAKKSKKKNLPKKEILKSDPEVVEKSESKLRPLELIKQHGTLESSSKAKSASDEKPDASGTKELSEDDRDFAWLLEQPAKHYVLQLNASSSKKHAEQFIKKQGLCGQCVIVKKRSKQSDLFVVLFGVFENRAKAKLSAENFKELGVLALIYRFSAIQNEVRKTLSEESASSVC